MDQHNMQAFLPNTPSVSAIVIAAGLSRRMGKFKLTLPWAGSTVIASIVATLRAAPLREIVVVTGYRAADVGHALAGTAARCVHNPDYEAGGMLSSIVAGLRALGNTDRAALLCLGDQPQMQPDTIRAVLSGGDRTGWQKIVLPSYRMRTGHPILLPVALWPQIMNTTETLRTVLRSNADMVHYVTVDTPSILDDLDTPDDYQRATGEAMNGG